MSVSEIITLILSILTALTVGGIIGSIISLRHRGKVEKAKATQEESKANQEIAQADTLNIHNTSELITLYKKALDDVNQQKKDIEKSYLEKITEYEVKLAQYDDKLKIYKDDANRRDKTIGDLSRSLLKMQVEMDNLREIVSSKCGSCAFRDACAKRKAVTDESFNDKNILGNK